MARTIGHHLPGDLPRNAFLSACDYCGAMYYRHQLRRDRSGLLACEDDYGGDVVTLSEANAAAAQSYRGPQNLIDGGFVYPKDTDTPPPIVWPDGIPPIGYRPTPPVPPPVETFHVLADRIDDEVIYDDRGTGDDISA